RDYHAVWVYGDPAVYALVREYGFAPEVAAKVGHTGYFDAAARRPLGRADGDASIAAAQLAGVVLTLGLVSRVAVGALVAGRALGLVDLLHPRDLSPATLTAWLAAGRTEVQPARERIDFNGLMRVPRLLEEVLGRRPPLSARRRRRAEVHRAANGRRGDRVEA